jgi:hypothetical protein
MTNTAEMTNTDLEAAYAEACRKSNAFFDVRDYRQAKKWHEEAVRLQLLQLERINR